MERVKHLFLACCLPLCMLLLLGGLPQTASGQGFFGSDRPRSRQFSRNPNGYALREGYARIYLMRNLSGRGTAFQIVRNKQHVGELGGGSYLCFDIKAGKRHVFGACLIYDGHEDFEDEDEDDDNVLFITPEAGAVYYVRAEYYEGFITPHLEFKIMDDEEGEEMLAEIEPPYVEE